MRTAFHFLLFVACVFVATPQALRAQPSEPRIEAARALVQGKDALLAPMRLYEMTADLFCRSYFIELRRDAEWGPNHPIWSRLLPEFCAELVQLALPDGQSLEGYLQAELAKELTQGELLDMGARNSDVAAIAASRRLQELGLNWIFVVQASKPPGTARLYSRAEREVAIRTAQILRDQAPEVSADVRSAFIYLDAPSFISYQRAVGQAFMSSAGRLDPRPQGRFAAFMRGWHERVGGQAR